MRLPAVMFACIGALCSAPALAQETGAATVRLIISDIAEDEEALRIGGLHAGTLKSNGEAVMTLDLDPLEESLIIAACDFDCGELEIIARSKDGSVLDEAGPRNDGFVLPLDPGETRSVVLTVRMLDCRKDACAFGVGLFQRE